MAQIITKGSVIKQSIAASLVAVAQTLSFSHSSAEAEGYDATTIDQAAAGKARKVTGYTNPGTFDFEVFFDSQLAGHQALTDDITTPAGRDWSCTLVGGTEMTFTGGGMTFGYSGDMNDGIKGTVSIPLDGLMVYPT